MIEIWQECAKFLTTSQRLANQVRTIIKKGWFSDFENLEIPKKTHHQNYNIVSDTSTSKNENTTLPNDTLPSSHEETLSQEQKINQENLKRIMSVEKTTLPSLRNIEWKTL